jgi:hypothetical protein
MEAKKMIKDSIEKLGEIFTKYITVESISEKLEAKSGGEEAMTVKNFMDNKGYDVVGINDSESGLINGYIERSNLKNGKCEEYRKDFQVEEIVSSDTPLTDVLSKNSISEIVTRADLQKQPIRLFIFGFISLFEMHLLELIRKHFPNETWKDKLKKSRLEEVEKIYKQRKRKNEEIDLISCLQLCDKKEIIASDKEELIAELGFKSKNKWDKQFKNIEDMRNNLAHSQDLKEVLDPMKITELVDEIKKIIEKCQKIEELQEQKLK